MTEQQLIQNVALTKIPNIGHILSKNLLSYCGSADEVFKASKSQLLKIPGVGEHAIKNIHDKAVFTSAEKEIEFAQKNNVQILFYTDKKYPRRIKHFDNCPLILYYKGNADLNGEKMVGIVGTRNPSVNGRILTEKFVEEFKALNVSIVSGLAFGIDGIAHRKSLESGIETIGIMGHGQDMIYPAEHRELSIRMVEQGGLLTEFGVDTKPDRQNFPMRNRIIAALSDAVVVMESKARGGSIITAEIANEYNKDVFAVPGRPGDTFSAGCNGLIKRTKAHLMEDVEDFKYIMRWEAEDKAKAVQSTLFVDLSDEENSIVQNIRDAKEISIDELSYKLQKNTSTMSSLLLQLEFKGVIRSLPGKRYIIN